MLNHVGGCSFLPFETGERSQVFHRNRGEQPDERAKDRSPIFLMITESYLPALCVNQLKNCDLMLRLESAILRKP